jgi:hypothetical protein
VLTASAIPLNVGGWGPREGAAAWASAAAGLGAAQGVATAVAFAVMTFVGTLPGALVLAAGWLRRASAGAGGRRPPAVVGRAQVSTVSS